MSESTMPAWVREARDLEAKRREAAAPVVNAYNAGKLTVEELAVHLLQIAGAS